MCLKKSERKKDTCGSKTLKKIVFISLEGPNNQWFH